MIVHAIFASHRRVRTALSFFLTFLLLLPSFAALAHPLPQAANQARPVVSLPSPPVPQPKSVSQLKVGDIIRARDHASGKVEWKQVIHASKQTVSKLLSVQLTDTRTGKPAETLVCPLDQAVTLTDSRTIPAGRLCIGNSIITRAGPVCKVKALFLLRKPGGFVLCDVRIGPLSAAQAKVALSQEQSHVNFVDYKAPAASAAYATPASMGGGTVNPFLFQGQQYDPSSGDYYLRARYYDPAIGRFLSHDPFAGDDTDPASFNPYTYAHNDPVNRTDPGGQIDGLLGTIVSIGSLSALSATVLVVTADPANAPAPNSQIYSVSQLQDLQTGVFVIFTSEIGGRGTTYGIQKAFGIIGAGLASRALANELENGVSFVLKESDYLRFVKGKALIGRPDGQFCTTTATMDAVIAETGGEPVALGQKLGVNFGPGEKLYRVDIRDPLSLNPRLPNANMSGANENFIPGGQTSGGVPEIVVDQIPASQFTAYPLH